MSLEDYIKERNEALRTRRRTARMKLIINIALMSVSALAFGVIVKATSIDVGLSILILIVANDAFQGVNRK